MVEKNKKPEIRFKEYTNEWEERELGELFSITSASRVHKNEWTTSGVPFFRSSDVVADFKGITNNKAFISFELYEELSNKSGCVQKNDILVTGGGSIGIPYLIKTNEPLYFKDADLLWLKNGNNINGYFLYTFFSTLSFRRHVNSITHIGTISHYTIEQAKSTPIIVPEKEEQNKIGEYIMRIDNLITLHEQKYNKLVIIKKAMLEKMFPKNGAIVPEIRFKGFTEAWEQKELGEIGNTYTGLSGKSKDDFGHGEGKYVTYMNIFSNPIAITSLTEPVEVDGKQNEVKVGDVFFTTSSETPEEVGMSSVWIDSNNNTYLNSFCFGYRPKEKFDNYYLAYMLRSSIFRKRITFLAQGISRYNISKNKVMEIAVPIPKINEQEKIGNYFKHLDTLITLQKSELEKLKNIKKACLEKMFV